MLFSKARPALRRAIRTVVESLEDRRLLAAATIGTPSSAGTGLYLPVTLTGPGAPTLTTANLSLHNLTAPDTAETHPVSVSTAGSVTTFKLNRPIGGSVAVPLEDGWYDASVRHAALTPDEVAGSFGFLNADFDGDGGVSINDYNILAGNWGKTHHPDGSPMTFAEGDADYDGGVSINDFNILANRFGMTLPAAPTQAGGVAVGNTTAGMLDVIWNADPTETRDGFKVYRSDDGGQTYTLIHTEADPAARTWQDTGPTVAQNGDPAHPLTLGQKYWYRVRSYTDANGANASVTRAWGIPTRPTAAVTDLYTAGIGPGRVALKWKAPADPSVKGYRVYRSTSPNFLPSSQTLVTTVSSQKLAYIDSGLSRGHTYYYRVVAVGLENSVAMPSLPASAPAQNQGQGFSNAGNGGVPFDPATHDSDGDGTVDLQDNDNDNDGVVDEADDDDDDDNNGVPDNAEPDDRDTDGDGTSDNDDGDGMSDVNDSDDDNDLTTDDEDASTGDIDAVPTGAGSFTVFSTFAPYVANPSGNYGYTPHYVDMDYTASETEEDLDTGETIELGPKMNFSGDGSQTFTLSNLPKHSIIGFHATLLGGGFTTPQTPDETGSFEISFGDKTYEPDSLAWGSISGGAAYFNDEYAESTDDKLTITISGSGFDEQDGWNISTLTIGVVMPEASISVDTSAIEEEEHKQVWNEDTEEMEETSELKPITYTVSRSGPPVGDLDVSLDWSGTASSSDVSNLTSSKTIPDGESSITFEVTVKDDPEAEGVETLIGKVKDPGGGTPKYKPATGQAITNIDDNASVQTIEVKVVADPDPPYNYSFAFGFNVVTIIKGEHLDRVYVTQMQNCTTSFFDNEGVPISSEDTLATIQETYSSVDPNTVNSQLGPSGDWPTDTDWYWDARIRVANGSKGGVGILGDNQTGFAPDQVEMPLNANDPTSTFTKSNLAQYNRNFNLRFGLHEADGSITEIKSHAWGYNWNNYAALWTDNEWLKVWTASFKGSGTFSGVYGITGLS